MLYAEHSMYELVLTIQYNLIHPQDSLHGALRPGKLKVGQKTVENIPSQL